LSPDLANAIDLEVVVEDLADPAAQTRVAADASRRLVRVAPASDMGVVCRWGDRQNLADRLDPMGGAVIVDEGDHRFNGRSSSAWAK
jgi:hypothetical protein